MSQCLRQTSTSIISINYIVLYAAFGSEIIRVWNPPNHGLLLGVEKMSSVSASTELLEKKDMYRCILRTLGKSDHCHRNILLTLTLKRKHFKVANVKNWL